VIFCQAIHGESKACGKPAEYAVFWPGRDTLLMCEEDTLVACRVADAMGFNLPLQLAETYMKGEEAKQRIQDATKRLTGGS